MNDLLVQNATTEDVHVQVEDRGHTGTSLRIWVDAGSASRASAAVDVDDDVVYVQFMLSCARVHDQVREVLVDRVLSLPAVQRSHVLHAAAPLGDSILLEQLRRLMPDASMRAAGCTCLIDAALPGSAGLRPLVSSH